MTVTSHLCAWIKPVCLVFNNRKESPPVIIKVVPTAAIFQQFDTWIIRRPLEVHFRTCCCCLSYLHDFPTYRITAEQKNNYGGRCLVKPRIPFGTHNNNNNSNNDNFSGRKRLLCAQCSPPCTPWNLFTEVYSEEKRFRWIPASGFTTEKLVTSETDLSRNHFYRFGQFRPPAHCHWSEGTVPQLKRAKQ